MGIQSDRRSCEALVQYLQERGLETEGQVQVMVVGCNLSRRCLACAEGWGKGQTKTTKKFWEEPFVYLIPQEPSNPQESGIGRKSPR
eukprot:1330516-Amphidinium_carterae.1